AGVVVVMVVVAGRMTVVVVVVVVVVAIMMMAMGAGVQLARRDARRRRHGPPREPGRLRQARQPLLETQAMLHQDRGLGQVARRRRSGLIFMRIAVRPDQR